MQVFKSEFQVRFADCDPAGIVFYPRYFEMFNAIVEDWCEHGCGMSFHELIVERGWGLPTVHLETDFIASSMMGERLGAALSVTRIGGASIDVAIRLTGPDGSARVNAKVVLVLTERARSKAIPLPPALRERIEQFMQA